MALKLLIIASVMVAVNAGLLGGAAHHGGAFGYASPAARGYADYDPNPQYTFSYSVADAFTGDNKDQTETRNGDVVHGKYSLIEPDGNRRTVEYTADPVSGFNAVVHNSGGAFKAGAAYAAPLAKPFGYRPAPVAAFGAPLAARPYAAPFAARPYAAHAFPGAGAYGKAFATTHFSSPHAVYSH